MEYAAEKLFFTWLVVALFFTLPVFRLDGPVEGYYANGPGRWRFFWAIPTQLLVLPALLAFSYAAHGFSFEAWCKKWEQRASRAYVFAQGRASTAEMVFIYLFPGWLLLDWVLVEVRPLMALHHIVCIIGHVGGVIIWPWGFPWYFAGVVALEIGSCCCNIMCVWARSRCAMALLIVGMTASNLTACATMRRWALATRPFVGKVIGMFITVGLAYVREEEAFKSVTHHMKLPPFVETPYVPCGRLYLFRTASESAAEVLKLVLVWALVWAGAWLGCAFFAKHFLAPLLPASSVAWENHSCYVGQKLVAWSKSCAIAGMANFALYDLYMGLPLDSKSRWDVCGHYLAELAGMHFTAFEVADLVLLAGYGFLSMDQLLHHLLHIALGCMIRCNCGPILTASILMAQETSGIFLNYLLLIRNRAPAHWGTMAAQACFMLTFYIWRLGLGTWGTLVYLRDLEVVTTYHPQLSTKLIGVALVFASIQQWYWGALIFKSFMKRLRNRAASEQPTASACDVHKLKQG